MELAKDSPIIIQNSSNPSSQKIWMYNCTTVWLYKVLLLTCVVNCTVGTPMPRLCPVVQWSVHWAPSQMTWVLVLALGKCCSLETCGKKEMQAPLLGLAKSIYYKTNSSVIDHRGHQNVVGTSVTPSPAPMCHFFVLTTFWRHLWPITEQTHSNLESIC